MVGIRPKKTLNVQQGHSLLCMDLTKLIATDSRSFVLAFARKRLTNSLAVELPTWWVSKMTC
jgi:hypothetical protein